jgi:hypothetical protein
VGLGMIAGETLLQGAQYLPLMLVLGHVDEIDDDDAAEVAQPQLPTDRLGRLQVGLEDGLFEIAVADEGAGIDVDGGHGLGLVDHQMSAGLELDLALQRLADLLLHPVEIEQRALALVVVDALLDLGDVFGGEGHGLIDHRTRVDADPLHLGRHQIAQGPHGQRQIVVDQTDLGRRRAALADPAPELGQKGHVAIQRLLGHAVRRGTRNEAALALVRVDIVLQDLAQTPPLVLVLDLLRDPGACQRRHADQVARGHRDIGRQPRAFGAQRILHDLHDEPIALVHQLVDLIAARLALGSDDVGGVEEGGAIQTDVHKRRLHPGQDPTDTTLVDVADQTAALGALDDDLLHHAVLDHGDPGFRRRDIDQDLFAHGNIARWPVLISFRAYLCSSRKDRRRWFSDAWRDGAHPPPDAGPITWIPAAASNRPVSNSGSPITPE